MELPIALALSDLPLAGQQALLKQFETRHAWLVSNKNSTGLAVQVSIGEALAASNTTHIDVVNKLVDAKSPTVRGLALSRTTNTRAIRQAWKLVDINTDKIAVARNPLVPIELLAEAMHGAEHGLLASLYMNPSTPVAAKRKVNIDDIFWNVSGLSKQHRIARNFMIVHSNKWMMEEPTSWRLSLQHAIANHPDVTKDTLQKLYQNVPATVGRHPVYNGVNLATCSVSELLDLNLVVATMTAVQRPELTFADINRVLRGLKTPAPQVLGTLANRYGLGALFAHTTPNSMWTKLNAKAAWRMAPALEHANECDQTRCLEAITVNKILGNNMQNWETFLALMPDWHDNLTTAAKTACNL